MLCLVRVPQEGAQVTMAGLEGASRSHGLWGPVTPTSTASPIVTPLVGDVCVKHLWCVCMCSICVWQVRLKGPHIQLLHWGQAAISASKLADYNGFTISGCITLTILLACWLV